MKAIVSIDGASRGNPGPSSCSAVIRWAGETRLYGLNLGVTTNNVAEYSGLILGLTEALRLGADEVEALSDSNLCVQQVRGEYKVKSANLAPLHKKVMSLLRRFRKWEIRHVPREQNHEADAMSNAVLDLDELIRRG